MSVNNFKELRRHIGHTVDVVCYGVDGEEPHNVAIECEDCNEVLVDFDNPADEADEGEKELAQKDLDDEL